MKIFLGVLLAVVVVALVWRLTSKDKTALPEKEAITASIVHNTKILEVIQASSYTYLKVKEDGNEYWIATIKEDAREGDKYSYGEGLEMVNFRSEELDRTFPVILFVNEDGGFGQEETPEPAGMGAPVSMGKPRVDQAVNTVIAQSEGGISIGELYKNRDAYSGKKIRVKGKVVKINPEVMDRNWVHIQDGTSDGDYFDLTVTTLETVVVDDIVEFEGTIVLNKDFGAGYVYEVIMEGGILKK